MKVLEPLSPIILVLSMKLTPVEPSDNKYAKPYFEE